MRKFKIHYNKNGYEDELLITGESIEEIRKITFEECEKRGWDFENCWSEEL